MAKFLDAVAARHECTCRPTHSVAKLGHSDDCEWYRSAQPTLVRPELLGSIGCPPQHLDGTPHDFDWATYEGARESYGVCRCGYDARSHALWTFP